MALGQLLIDHLAETNAPKDVQEVIMATAMAGKEIYESFKTKKIVYSSHMNSSGDIQLSHDLIADEIMQEAFRKSGVVSCYVSEEKDTEVCFLEHVPDKLLVAYDPVDGSSVVGAGLAVGTSVGIYRGVKEFTQATGRDQVGSAYVIYGPRVLFVYTVCEGVHFFALDEKTGKYHLEQENLTVENDRPVCGIGGMQHACNVKGFPDLIDYWESHKYVLRYSGSMAADVNGILYRGGGVFVYPAEKLRLLYECYPFALMVEQAGGKCTDLEGNLLLDHPVSHIDSASSVIMGSKAQVDRAVKYFNDPDQAAGCRHDHSED